MHKLILDNLLLIAIW